MSAADLIRTTAAAYGVNPELAIAVARRESGLNQAARGAAGEIGVFQLMPGTAAELGVNPYDLEQNINGGIRYLKQQIDRFGPERGLQAYNGGARNVEQGTVSTAARSYARAILAAAGNPSGASLSLPGFSLPEISTFEAIGISPWTLGVIAAAALAAVSVARR